MPQTLMLIGGSDRTNGDYSWLLSHEGKKSIWSCPKRARIGDTAFIYIAAPVSQIIATAKVITVPVEGRRRNSRWRYVCDIGPIRLLKSPISIDELKRLCPGWAWLRYPRAYAYIPEREAKLIARRSIQVVRATVEAEARGIGAGFGDSETNRKVEQASIRAVRRFYEQQGFHVASREKENLGYDLEVTSGRRKLHVEVKGVSGSIPAFPITLNEVRCAKEDRLFRLAVVTDALDSKQRRVRLLSGPSFLRRFKLRELSYMATPKANGRGR